LADASESLVKVPSTFKTGGDFKAWLETLEKAVFRNLTGKELPAEDEADTAKAWKDLKKDAQDKTHEGADAPRGALVFYADHVALSNGDGTVIAADASGAPDPSAPIGGPLGWVDVPSGAS